MSSAPEAANAQPEEIPESCKAAIVTDYGAPLELQQIPVPAEIEPGAILVKIECTTLCGSDVHFWDGQLSIIENILPAIPGHEFVGRIVKFGAGPQKDSVGNPLAIGDRIVWEHEACGFCHACNVLREAELCENRRHYMFFPCTEYPYLTGGLAEYCYVLPNSGRLRVPDDVKSEWASASSCALRTVLHGFETLGRLSPWDTAVIQGAGPLGLFATAVAKRSGAGRVITVGSPDDRLAVASDWGADDVIPVDTTEPDARAERVLELTAGRGADVVMEFSGGPGAFGEGIRFVRPGGRFVIVGQVGPNEEKVVPSTIMRKNISVLGSFSATIAHYWQGLEFIRKTAHEVDYDAMISNHYSLDEAQAAMTAMRDRTEIKPVVWPDGAP